MKGLIRHGPDSASPVADSPVDAGAALDALAEFERLAADRRARAESVLAQARELEDQLSAARTAIVPLAAASETAHLREREADERVRAARDELHRAQAALNAALHALSDCRADRARADADVAEMHARLDALSKTNGLSTDAAKRVVERRLADERRRATGPE
jgi:chromosome segregation ATPase